MAGDPVEENATGYLMRNAQWLVQVVGVDGLRIDAAKHVQGFVLDFLDRAVYRQNPRPLLDGVDASRVHLQRGLRREPRGAPSARQEDDQPRRPRPHRRQPRHARLQALLRAQGQPGADRRQRRLAAHQGCGARHLGRRSAQRLGRREVRAQPRRVQAVRPRARRAGVHADDAGQHGRLLQRQGVRRQPRFPQARPRRRAQRRPRQPADAPPRGPRRRTAAATTPSGGMGPMACSRSSAAAPPSCSCPTAATPASTAAR